MWHAAADGLKSLEAVCAAPDRAFDELAPDLGEEIWNDAWTVQKAACEALAIAAKHDIRFTFTGPG